MKKILLILLVVSLSSCGTYLETPLTKVNHRTYVTKHNDTLTAGRAMSWIIDGGCIKGVVYNKENKIINGRYNRNCNK